MITIEPSGESVKGPCPHCGLPTRTVWGYVYNDDNAHAVYYLRWTDGHLEDGALMAISIGGWGEGADPSERRCFAFECRVMPSGPGFVVIDAQTCPWGDAEVLGQMLTRESALKSEKLKEVYSIIDTVVANDHRFQEFLAGNHVQQRPS